MLKHPVPHLHHLSTHDAEYTVHTTKCVGSLCETGRKEWQSKWSCMLLQIA